MLELIVVVSILSVLVSISTFGLNATRENAKHRIAETTIEQIFLATKLQYEVTGEWPNGETDCKAGSELNLQGNTLSPYLENIPLDPWGRPYQYDNDFQCFAGSLGCNGVNDSGVDRSVIFSCGPTDNTGNSNATGFCRYDTDNIVLTICQP